MNATTKTAMEALAAALEAAGIAPEVFPEEPVASYYGAQCYIGDTTVNYFLRDEEGEAACWCLEITYEDGTYDSHESVTPEQLKALLSAIPRSTEITRFERNN